MSSDDDKPDPKPDPKPEPKPDPSPDPRPDPDSVTTEEDTDDGPMPDDRDERGNDRE